ncbi:MAG TPA: exodeoxyribonuclease III [Candidatus Hydrogenedentes bacterium]|nr:exodeoxyribonuclease III [Candidatus Hydrogenedentota bacterium]HOS03375.1 exodeoxyribonuclease III [Candidatus Hydrogenedentota bacterium]
MPIIATWNVNGIRAAVRNGFLAWLDDVRPDIVCLQETRAGTEDLPDDVLRPPGYESLWRAAAKKGYSGVAVYYKPGFEPMEAESLGDPRFDLEGRALVLAYKDFTLINAYYPNSQPEKARLEYKLAFCDAMLAFCQQVRRAGKNIVVCGDYNIAPTEIDLARPAQNENSAGYYPEERAAMQAFLAAGYVDAFRLFCPDPGHYTWWSYRAKAREKNIGWRIDHHCVNREFAGRVKSVIIQNAVMGSDHCPVLLTLKN